MDRNPIKFDQMEKVKSLLYDKKKKEENTEDLKRNCSLFQLGDKKI